MRKILGTALLAMALSTNVARATILPDANVPGMVKDSDVILVGRVDGVRFQRDSGLSSETLYILVDRTLKGGERSRRVSVKLNLADPTYRPLTNHQYGIFFLRRTPGGYYTGIDPYHPALAASPTPGKASFASGALSEVAQELVHVLATPAEKLNDQLGFQPASAEVSTQADEIFTETAEALKTAPYQTAGPALRAVAASGSLPARLWAINCLFSILDDVEEHEALKAQYLDSLKEALIKPTPGIAAAVTWFAVSMEGHVGSPKAAPALAAMLGSTDLWVRRAAALSLGNIAANNATEGVVVPLAKLALNDSDRDVRYYAVLGLTRANRDPDEPTVAAFEKKESEMLNFWRNWARLNVR